MSIAFPTSLKTTGGARTGIAPANLLDLLDVNGNLYYFSDRNTNAPIAIAGSIPTGDTPPAPPVPIPDGQYVAWSFPTSFPATQGSGSAVGSPSTGGGNGTVEMPVGGPFTSAASLTFEGFIMPTLPAGAVIQQAIAVANISYSGYGLEGPFAGGFDTPAGTEWDGNYTQAVSLPNPLTPTDPSFSFGIDYSLVPPGPGLFGNPLNPPELFTISGLAIAIYYSLPFTLGPPPPPYSPLRGAPYLPWLLEVPSFSFYRSLQVGTGSFVIQNVSGDTFSRDIEKLLRASALEGAFFIYRLWQPDAEAAWIEVHGTLTVDDDGADTVTFKAVNLLNPSQDDTPLEIYSETCQLQWGGPRCGSTQTTECQYSFQTCQVVERIMIEANDYEKNFGEATANTALNVINRRRKI